MNSLDQLKSIFKYQLGQSTPVTLDFDVDLVEEKSVESVKLFYLLQIEDQELIDGKESKLVYIQIRSCFDDELIEKLGKSKFLRYGTDSLPVFENNEISPRTL